MSTRDHNNCTYNNFKPTSHVPTIELEEESAATACDRLSLDVSFRQSYWNHVRRKSCSAPAEVKVVLAGDDSGLRDEITWGEKRYSTCVVL